MIKFNNYTLKKLESLFEELDYRVMYEKGNFQSGYCIVEHKNIIVINKFYDTEARINSMLDVLSQISPDHNRLSQASKQLLKKVKADPSEPELFSDQNALKKEPNS